MIGLLDVTARRVKHCSCWCHQWQFADAARARHLDNPQLAFTLRQQGNTTPIYAPLDASEDGVVAAAVACDSCRNQHCGAFGHPPRPAPAPWVDPPPSPPPPAHGCAEDDDGN